MTLYPLCRSPAVVAASYRRMPLLSPRPPNQEVVTSSAAAALYHGTSPCLALQMPLEGLVPGQAVEGASRLRAG
jgi:hypothetical protein